MSGSILGRSGCGVFVASSFLRPETLMRAASLSLHAAHRAPVSFVFDHGAQAKVSVGSPDKRLPLERYFRDGHAGLYHPPDNDETLETLGRDAFTSRRATRMRYGLEMEAQPPCRREANRRVDE